VVPSNLALIDHPSQPAGPRKDTEQRHFGQRDGGSPVVGQEDLVATGGELVTAAGAHPAHRGDPVLPRVVLRVLDGEAGLVGELAKVDFEMVRRGAQHQDVGACAPHPLVVGAQHHGVYPRVLEAQPHQQVGELDVHPEVIGVELQLVAFGDGRFRVDAEGDVGTGPVDR
jgi:hypothetical protein